MKTNFFLLFLDKYIHTHACIIWITSEDFDHAAANKKKFRKKVANHQKEEENNSVRGLLGDKSHSFNGFFKRTKKMEKKHQNKIDQKNK
jgi:hypothetical protein